MSLQRLGARMTRLEAQRVRTTSPSGLVIVWMADGDTRATALQRAGLTSAEMASRVVLFVQYEVTRSHGARSWRRPPHLSLDKADAPTH